MNFLIYSIVLLLAVGLINCAPTDDVSHDQAVDEAIAEAEHAQEAPPGQEDPLTDELNVPEEEGDPPVETADSEDPPAPAADVDYPEDEIISLPHLPDPKYDEEGDVLWFPRIIGGSRAQLGEFPSKVSLQTRTGSHFCGGNLITSNHVLSAAHCVVPEDGFLLNPASIEIMAGDISITGNPGPNRVYRIASHIFVHQKYDSHTMENDIAVLRVSVPFHTREAILNPEPLALGVPVTGTKCNLAGWGATSEGSNTASPNLMRVNLEIVDRDRCNTSYQGMVGADMFCAGTMAGGRDACQGDSGGGLMCNGVITGVVSFGYGCGRPRFPGVYTDVSVYAEFIDGALNFEGTHDEIPQPEFRPSSAYSIYPGVFSLLAVISYLLV